MKDEGVSDVTLNTCFNAATIEGSAVNAVTGKPVTIQNAASYADERAVFERASNKGAAEDSLLVEGEGVSDVTLGTFFNAAIIEGSTVDAGRDTDDGRVTGKPVAVRNASPDADERAVLERAANERAAAEAAATKGAEEGCAATKGATTSLNEGAGFAADGGAAGSRVICMCIGTKSPAGGFVRGIIAGDLDAQKFPPQIPSAAMSTWIRRNLGMSSSVRFAAASVSAETAKLAVMCTWPDALVAGGCVVDRRAAEAGLWTTNLVAHLTQECL